MDDRRAQEPTDTRDTRASFSGDLSEVALAELVQTLERRSGTVRLVDRAGLAATVWLREGRVVDCEVGEATGEAAFYRLLRWSAGEFAVEFDVVLRPPRITSPTQALVMEGLRRADAWRRAVAPLPDLGALVEIDFRLLSDRLAEIPDDVNALLRLVDGKRTLGQVLDEAGVDDLAAAAMLGRLFAEEIVRVATPRPAAPAATTPEPERVTWFTGPGEPEAPAAPRPTPPPAPPASAPAPAPAPPAPAPERAPAPRGGPPRIVRFPPRERPAITPRPGDTPAVAPAPGAREETRLTAPPRVAPPRPSRAPGRRGAGGWAVAAAAAVAAVAGGAMGWRSWRAAAAASYEQELEGARRARAEGRLADAVAGYRRALAARDTSDGQAELGQALVEAAEPGPAIAALRRAVELDGGNAGAYMALGAACLGEQRLAEARWAFERYLALEPQGARAAEARAALDRMK